MNSAKSFMLFSQPYLNRTTGCYLDIITLNIQPQGPLARMVRRISYSPLSSFKVSWSQCTANPSCILAIVAPMETTCCQGNLGQQGGGSYGCLNLVTNNSISDLFSYLLSNGYVIDTSITTMLHQGDVCVGSNEIGRRLLAMVTYAAS
jgi:hypothetical protein